MIKINLRKRRDLLDAGPAEKAGNDFVQSVIGKIDTDAVKELPIKRIVIPIIIGFIASTVLDEYKDSQIKKIDEEIVKTRKKTEALQLKIAGYKTYDIMKKTLDEDESVLKTKLDTIHTLMANRSVPPKILETLSTSIPKDTWLTGFQLKGEEISLRGQSYGFNQISEFMRNLGNSPLVGKVDLKSSQQNQTPEFGEVAVFELQITKK